LQSLYDFDTDLCGGLDAIQPGPVYDIDSLIDKQSRSGKMSCRMISQGPLMDSVKTALSTDKAESDFALYHDEHRAPLEHQFKSSEARIALGRDTNGAKLHLGVKVDHCLCNQFHVQARTARLSLRNAHPTSSH